MYNSIAEQNDNLLKGGIKMKIERLFALVLAIGLISSSLILFQRADVEKGYKNYEITLDYTEMVRFADIGGEDLDYYLREFKEAGASSINIGEATINSLKQNMDFKIRTELEGFDLVVMGSREGLEFIENGLKDTLIEERNITYRDENTLVIEGYPRDFGFDTTIVRDFNGNRIGGSHIGQASKIEYAGLGFLDSEIEAAKESGLNVLLRPVYVSQIQNSREALQRFEDTLNRHSIDQRYIIFGGEEAIGTDDELEALAEIMEDRNMSVGMIEASVQREHLDMAGMKPLVERLNYDAVRVFTTWPYIQRRFDYGIPLHHNGEEIMNTYYRAITERNIRVIYFRPFITPSGKVVTDMELYKARFGELQQRLEKTHSIVPGEINTMDYLRARRTLQMLSALGTLAGGFIILDNLLKIKRKHILSLFGISIVGVSAIYVLNIKLDIVNKMFGLLSTIVFPSISGMFVLATVREILKQKNEASMGTAYFRGILILLLAVVISLIGAIFQVSFFAQSKYLLELDIFKGVKISQVAPMGIIMLVYLSYFGYGRKNDEIYIKYEELKEFFLGNIKIWQALIVGVLLGAVALLLLRSGHESNVEPSSMELLVRNLLEIFLPARPRNKAFLLGYPGLVLMVYLAFKKKFVWSFPAFALIVMIGQSNILNTFSHIRTPIYMSYLRVSYELVITLFTSAIFVLVAEGAIKLIEKGKGNA